METILDQEKRKQITVWELARLILRIGKEGKIGIADLPNLHQYLCPENKEGYTIINQEFADKFFEAIALLKRRGLLMDVITRNRVYVQLTSFAQRTEVSDDIIILIDDAKEIVKSVKEAVSNLDDVVEQYYLESLRACQEGLYISSVICLGTASERAINCLADAIIECNPKCKKDIEKQFFISHLKDYLIKNFKDIFEPISDRQLKKDLKENLVGIANIYRLNRNIAGHPKSIPQDWRRDEQENYLNQFRRYIITIFKAITLLRKTENI